MGSSKQPNGDRSKFTPTGNEQGSKAVQPDGQDRTADNREEEEAQRGSQNDESEHDQQGDAPGIFSTLVGDGKDG